MRRSDNQLQSAVERPTGVAMDLKVARQQQRRERTPSKAYHVVPLAQDADNPSEDEEDASRCSFSAAMDEDEDATARARARAQARGDDVDRSSTSSGEDRPRRSSRRRGPRVSLASSRIQRDKLMRTMENLILQEAELSSAYERFEYSRHKCELEHDEITARLEQYQGLLQHAQRRERELQASGVLTDAIRSQEDHERWQQTKIMVQSTLPELLARLEEKIEDNGTKIRHIQERMERIRAQRLELREEIAEREDEIAVALAACPR
ncbi:hypothetical protein P43SY_000768 [Pythium insidiosum]|uniref:Uncharacterized protein n=1 Tax=Pythium insidiosum TaxID=114742 RepID=A0AAD5LWP6_PYTIN|nr:hypothetical protein P43SY_000768 [Pythium insidiosum]